jgi:4-hydroxy-3-methylbut-2-enyl diphosphate reductase
MEATRHYEQGREIILVGHHGHPEVVGTLGQLPAGAIHLVESAEDARAFVPRDSSKLAYVTQTTLSLDDTAEIVAVLKERFPQIGGPVKEDICYATTNRQNAVKTIAPKIDGLLVIGGPKSSNSLRLVEVAAKAGCKFSFLVERANDIPWRELEHARTIGITAGASAPEIIVEEVVEAIRERYDLDIEVVTTLEERVVFNVPREVRAARTQAEQR